MFSRKVAFLCTVLVFAVTQISAQMLPQAVLQDVPSLTPRGEGVMRFFGLKVYDVRLWTAAAMASAAFSTKGVTRSSPFECA